MRELNLEDSNIEQITLVTEPADRQNDNIDVWVHLKDGRHFSFTVFTIRNLQMLLARDPTFASPGMLIVAELSDSLIIKAIRAAWASGIEKFGVLQTPPLSSK